MACERVATFKYKNNTLLVEQHGSRSVYRYVYSDDISEADFTTWPTLFTGDSGTSVSGCAPAGAGSPLTVRSVDMKVPSNTKQHHTDKFEVCQSKSNPQLVVRRGQSFRIEIEFSRPYDSNSDTVKLIFQAGNNPMVNKGTEVVIDLPQKNKQSKWRAKIASVKCNILTLDITPPANCCVARWRFSILVTKQCRSDTIIYLYQHASQIYILFNPWCKEDEVYFPDEPLLSEYVLDSEGIIFIGDSETIFTRAWNYYQFDSSILDITMDILDLANMNWTQRGSPTVVTRGIAAMVNYQDDFGVLYGNWGPDYSGGTNPSSWTGSRCILQQFNTTKQTVKFSQCWVFAGVANTLSRALGLPSRVVTCFESAHDNDGSITIDVYLDSNGDRIEHQSDTIWNFHVWNEAWMTRPDLPAGYGGWQAFDASPQGLSNGRFRRGPVSVKAVREGEVNLLYDGPFFFAEVNGDVYYFRKNSHGITEVAHIEYNSIGKKISTKAPNSNKREDLTDSYKYAEGTEEEKAAILKAGRTASTRPEMFSKHTKEDVVFTLVPDPNKRVLGSPFVVSLVIKNTSNEKRTVANGRITVSSMYYTGRMSKELEKLEFRDIVINPGEETSQTIEVTVDEYFNQLEAFHTVSVSASALIKTTLQYFMDTKAVALLQPPLRIKVPKDVRVRQSVKIEVDLVNPYKTHALTNCIVSLDGFGVFDEYEAGNISPGDIFRAQIPVTVTSPGEQEFIVSFNSHEMKGLNARSVILVQE